MSKRDKIMELFFVKYPEFVKKHALGVLFAYSLFMLFAMFVVSGDLYKFIQYICEYFR